MLVSIQFCLSQVGANSTRSLYVHRCYLRAAQTCFACQFGEATVDRAVITRKPASSVIRSLTLTYLHAMITSSSHPAIATAINTPPQTPCPSKASPQSQATFFPAHPLHNPEARQILPFRVGLLQAVSTSGSDKPAQC